MTVPNRAPAAGHDNERPAPPPHSPSSDAAPRPSQPAKVPRTRTAAAWVGICATALGFVVLVIFMLQNTGRTEVSFLWLEGSLPLAVALLIAAVGAALVATTIGAARIAQLRRLIRRRR